jgi:DNA modification methylase
VIEIRVGDCREILRTLNDRSVHCCVTSPPYFGLRDYGHGGQIGLEPTPDAFVAELVAVFREVRRVLRDDGTLWLNLGDSYVSVGNGAQGVGGPMATRRVAQVRDRKAVHSSVERPPSVPGLPAKNLIGIPWRVAFALQSDGWYLRQDIIWHKPNPMPESVRDRCTKAHEYVFLLSKSERYHYDAGAISEASQDPRGPGNIGPVAQPPGERSGENANTRGSLHKIGAREYRNRRSVWTVATQPFSGAHFATFPPELIEPCIKAGCPADGTVLDPFGGAGTTGLVADRLARHAVLIELNPEYAQLARDRIIGDAPLFTEVV